MATKAPMPHLSEVLRILDGALALDPKKAIEYGALLADKLELESPSQARAVRATLSKSSARALAGTSVETVPMDATADLEMIDVFLPGIGEHELVLHPHVESTLRDFVRAVQKREELVRHGAAPANRLLLVGPPGTGKTTAARWVADQLHLPILVTRSDAMVSSLLGETSRNVRKVFEFAEARPCVLFLDEFDALAKRRDDPREVGELQRVAVALIQNLDSIDRGTVVIAASNHPDLLDSAVWRRFDTTVRLGLPGKHVREKLWEMYLGHFAPPTAQLELLADLSDGLSAAAIQTCSVSIIRDCVLTGEAVSSLPVALRRLARFTWIDDYSAFDSPQSELRALRDWVPQVFSIRVLADVFGVSTRQVTNAIKKGAHGGAGEPSAVLTAETKRAVS